MTEQEKRQKERVDANNAYVMMLWRSGASLATLPPSATFFPPRPTIKKDKNALEFFHPKSGPKLKIVD